MDLKQQILIALGLDKKEEEINLSFQAKLEDGTIVVSEADELAEGVEISVLSEDGSLAPLPVGEYKTEDALAIVVEEDGIVASVSQEEVEEEVEEVEEAPATEEVEEELESTEEVVAEEVEEPVAEEPVAATPKSVTTTTSTVEKIEFNKDEFLAEINDSIVALKSEIEGLKKENEDLKVKLSESAVEPLNLNKHSRDEYKPLNGGNSFLAKFNKLNK